MIIGARTGCWAKSGYTAKDYVQTNLTNILDGIENIGFGLPHDSELSAWTDCVTLNSNSFAKGENAYFGENCWHRTTALGEFTCGFPSPHEASTYEVVVKPTFASTQRIIGNGSGTASNSRFEVDCGNGRVRVYMRGSETSRYWNNIVPIVSGETFSLSITIDSNGIISIYKNGIFVRSNTTALNLKAYSGSRNTLRLGSWSGTSSAITADFFCARRYNGVLTAAEIAANYAIDKARFGLPG